MMNADFDPDRFICREWVGTFGSKNDVSSSQAWKNDPNLECVVISNGTGCTLIFVNVWWIFICSVSISGLILHYPVLRVCLYHGQVNWDPKVRKILQGKGVSKPNIDFQKPLVLNLGANKKAAVQKRCPSQVIHQFFRCPLRMEKRCHYRHERRLSLGRSAVGLLRPQIRWRKMFFFLWSWSKTKLQKLKLNRKTWIF